MTKIPFLTTKEMRAVDEAMLKSYHINLTQMMENAGRNLAHLARVRFLDGCPTQRDVLILVGRGGNGGGGLVCARRLHNWGANVEVITSHPDANYQGVPQHQLAILRAMNVPVSPAQNFNFTNVPPVDLVIDAIIGYGLSGPPRSTAKKMITAANKWDAPILSLDVPSGLDSATGEAHPPTIRATATLTLALPKEGLKAPNATAFVGELYLADISVPPQLYAQMGIELGAIFAEKDILEVKI